MTPTALAWRSLRHYRRTHAAVALGVAAAVAVLAGSFLVGSSVRSSLASITARRLGNTAVVIGSEMLFPESLVERLGATSSGAPVLSLRGLVRDERSRQRAANVQIYGVDDRFFAFHGVAGPAPNDGDVMFSPDLADELGPGGDDIVLVRVSRSTDIPIDSLYAAREDTGRSMRLRFVGVLAEEAMGEFSLAPAQGLVRAAFVRLASLQNALGEPGRVNTALLSDPGRPGPDRQPASAVRAALASTLTADDLGLTFDARPDDGTIIVESRAGLVPDRLAAAVTNAAARRSLEVTPVLSWLATRFESDGRSVPYSLITAIGPDADGHEALARMLLTRGASSADVPIVLNEWLARELAVPVGATITLEYFRWADEGRLVTDQATFRVAGVVPIQGVAADRRLAPDYPGITSSNSLADWDPPFPIDLRRVRPIDEAYWNQYRATPKAFIPLAAGQALWRTRYGQVTSLRIRPRPHDESGAAAAETAALSLQAAAAALAADTAAGVDPLGAGFGVVDVRRQNLAASAGATDFGAYFSYFSFFLVVSAVLLAALFFRLSIEQRLTEVGLLRAEGFSLAAVRRLFLVEGGLVAAGGSMLGIGLAIGWAALMMYGLRTWWVGAVGTTDLELHVDPASLALGAGLGGLASLLSIALTIGGLSKLAPRTLLTGGALAAASTGGRHAGTVALLSIALAMALTGATLSGFVSPVAGFFGAGALALVGGLAAFRRWLARPQAESLGSFGRIGLARFGLRNASWRPGRSLTSAALVASAVFLLVSVDAFRKGPDGSTGPQSGTGGFALIGESALPFVQDPRTPDGLEALGLSYGAADPDLTDVTFAAARLRPGEDASCLNLYQPKQPRVVGVSPAFVEANRFRFSRTLASTAGERDNPWRLLGPADAEGIAPVIIDATSLQYVMHAAVGDVITIDVETTRPVRLRVVGALADSMLQGELLVAEEAFLSLYPNQPGYRLLLVGVADASPERLAAVTATIEERMEPFGIDVEDTARRLESYHRVENTYLSTFQTLGGLGLVLGSLGLVAVVLRNVLERRRELALLGAAGYTAGDLQWLVLTEHLALVAAGLVIGVLAATLAIAPVFIERSGALPALPFFWIGVVALTGLAASVVATRSVRRMPLVPSLRSE